MEFLTTSVKSAILPIMTTWLSVTEAAQKTGYSAFYVRQLCRQGKLEAVKKGQMYLISPEDLDRYVQRMKALGSQKFNPMREEE